MTETPFASSSVNSSSSSDSWTIAGPGSGGLGIGLAIVRGIAEAHGGRVEVRSDGRGQGSEFRVALPIGLGRLADDVGATERQQSAPGSFSTRAGRR